MLSFIDRTCSHNHSHFSNNRLFCSLMILFSSRMNMLSRFHRSCGWSCPEDAMIGTGTAETQSSVTKAVWSSCSWCLPLFSTAVVFSSLLLLSVFGLRTTSTTPTSSSSSSFFSSSSSSSCFSSSVSSVDGDPRPFITTMPSRQGTTGSFSTRSSRSRK